MTAVNVTVHRTVPANAPFTLGIVTPEPWMRDASCAQVGGDDWFPPENGGVSNIVKEICNSCPVIGACLEFALRNNEKHGVWAGLSPAELARLRKAARQ